MSIRNEKNETIHLDIFERKMGEGYKKLIERKRNCGTLFVGAKESNGFLPLSCDK